MSFNPRKLFFSGIGGSGMSAMACFMADKGHVVVGSDRAFDENPDHPVYAFLRAKGIAIVPQDGSGIDRSFDCAVFSTAVESDRPEMVKARALRIPMRSRPEYLADIVGGFRTIAVAGTSGKSTASGMLAFLMERLGLDPNFIGGGRVKQFRTGTNPGNSVAGDSEWLVFEACESDGTIVNYRPFHTIILNLDLDHHTVEKTSTMFRTLMLNTGGTVIINGDDPNLRRIISKEAITFAIESPSDYRATDIVYGPFSTDFSLHGTRFTLALPGKHNLYNALSSIAALSEIGIPLREVSKVFGAFRGIERRFDILLDEGGRLVIDDYAHNPHKISALMEAVKNIRERVCYIFQPHGFGPTRMMKREYIAAFVRHLRATDHLILLPIYYAGGTARRDISSHDLADGVIAGGRSAEVADRETIAGRAQEWDTYVLFGARDETLSGFARQIAHELRKDRLQ
jgi:UDP-N-acetylmuramate--alanine ligase